MIIGGVSNVVPASVSAAIVSDLSTARASLAEDGVKITLSQSVIDAANLQRDMTRLNIGIAVLKSETQSEQAVVKMIQDSVDIRV